MKYFLLNSNLQTLQIFKTNFDRHESRMTGTKFSMPDTMSGTGEIFISGAAGGFVMSYLCDFFQRPGRKMKIASAKFWKYFKSDFISKKLKKRGSKESWLSILSKNTPGGIHIHSESKSLLHGWWIFKIADNWKLKQREQKRERSSSKERRESIILHSTSVQCAWRFSYHFNQLIVAHFTLCATS